MLRLAGALHATLQVLCLTQDILGLCLTHEILGLCAGTCTRLDHLMLVIRNVCTTPTTCVMVPNIPCTVSIILEFCSLPVHPCYATNYADILCSGLVRRHRQCLINAVHIMFNHTHAYSAQ